MTTNGVGRSATQLIRQRYGFTVVEILIATAITAMVMVGLCAAVNATVQSCRVNGAALDSSGRARLALGQMERSVRNADAVVRTSATRLDVVDGSSNAAAYVYDATGKQLNYVMGSGATAITAVLARNVTAVDFAAQSEADPSTQVMRIVRLTIGVTVTSNGIAQTFKTSVAPRRARTYQ